MNTAHVPAVESTRTPKDLHTDSAKTPHPLLWVSGAFAIALIVYAVAEIAGVLPPSDVSSTEVEPAVVSPFSQVTPNAK